MGKAQLKVSRVYWAICLLQSPVWSTDRSQIPSNHPDVQSERVQSQPGGHYVLFAQYPIHQMGNAKHICISPPPCFTALTSSHFHHSSFGRDEEQQENLLTNSRARIFIAIKNQRWMGCLKINRTLCDACLHCPLIPVDRGAAEVYDQ